MIKSLKIICVTIIFCASIPLFAQDTLTIYFANSQDQLSIQDQQKLNILASKITKKLIKKGIHIVGYADYIGNMESNQALSERRAKSVETHLLKNDINRDFIIGSIAVGSVHCRHDHKPTNGCQQHRKVDIIYSSSPLPVKDKKIDIIDIQSVVEVKDTLVETKSILNTEVGETLILDNINFVGGQDIWLEESVPALEKLLETLLENPTLEIEIQGHICCDAIDRINLSTKRALAIFNYLVKNGVEKKRLKYKGFGRDRPLQNNIEETRNRRVEILILHK